MKIKVAVMFGGRSVEHEVSVISAVQAMASLNSDKYEILPVYITKRNEFYYGAELRDIEMYRDIDGLLKRCQRIIFVSDAGKVWMVRYPSKKLSKNEISDIDVAFPIVHGTNVEDGVLQGYLKTLDLPFVGCDVLSSAVGMDKHVMKAVLKDAGIPVLDCLHFSTIDYADVKGIVAKVEGLFKYPVIVKPVNLGSSVGISKASSPEALEIALETAFNFAERVIVEPAVVSLKEINCSVLGDYEDAHPSECEEPIGSDEILSYSDKYVSGSKGSKGSEGMASLKRKIPADIDTKTKNEVHNIAVSAFKYLGCCGVARIDFLMDMDSGKVWLNEINTIPGSLAFYLWEAAGLKYTDMLDRLIALALKRRRREESITYSFDTNILSMGGGFGSKGSKR